MTGVTLLPFTIDRDKFSFPPRHCERNLTRFQEPRDWPADLEVLRQPLEESVIYIQSRGPAEYQYFSDLSGASADLWGPG
jgi:hypothetical protein